MTVWIELKDGTKRTFEKVERIIERAGRIELLQVVPGAGERLIAGYDKLQISMLGNSRILPQRFARRSVDS